MLAPSRELAAALFEAVERAHRDSGRAVWPTPRIRDFGSWLREHHDRRLAAGAVRSRCLEDVEERHLWREVLAADAGGVQDPEGLADAARRARRAMREHAIPFEALNGAAGEEAELLGRWIARFDLRCRELGCVASEDLLAGFAAAPEPVAPLDNPAWRPVARHWLARHARGPLAAPAAPRLAAFACRTRDPRAEAAAAAEWLRARLRDREDFRAWVLIPDLEARRAEIADAFDAALAPRRYALDGDEGLAPYALAGGTPLAEYPLVAAALELLTFAFKPTRFERFSALLRSPALQPDAAAAAVAARLDLALRAVAPDEAPAPRWLELGEQVRRRAQLPACAALERIGAALGRLHEPRGAQPMSRWIGPFVAAFEATTWVDQTRWSSEQYQSVERFRALLAELATADALLGTANRTEAAGRLAAAAREAAFQPETGVPPIWVTASIADPWLAYDALWIGGLDAGAWPQPVEYLPLLPRELQRRYGVQSASPAARLAAARDLGERWAARAPAAVFSLAEGESAGAVHPSPFWPAGIVDLEVPFAAPPPLWSAQRAHAGALEWFRDEIAPPFAADEATRGIATLRAQSQCPFRGFAHSRLRVEALGLPATGFDARERGQLVHEALERIWGALGSHGALVALEPPARARLIDEAIAAAIAHQRAQRDPGERWCRRERARLARLLALWLELEAGRSDFQIERLEQGRQIARHAGLEFSCRIDRIDRLADGGRVLIDYKSGNTSLDWRGERPANPQLPMYALLCGEGLDAVAYAEVNAAQCRFRYESGRDGALLPRDRRSSLEGQRDFTALLALWRRRIEALAEQFRDGHAAVDPLPGVCANCGLQGLCRIGEAADGEDD
ncbi:MAG: PD-(D/E)XK nuclease family protein [Gammaproteobacteria bacterium]|nr:PD-(D/E)XK nuclease family protein [Gammaproteobacteria bacterium]